MSLWFCAKFSIPTARPSCITENAVVMRFPTSLTKKTYPQDLLHVFENLAEKENSVGALKVVERMSKLSRLGPDEATALKKLCQWSAVGFKYLMEVINRLEVYETLDVKSSGNAGSITSGERLKMTNLVFNLLGKCEEDFFVSGRENILEKEI